jgi:hypothetical protein
MTEFGHRRFEQPALYGIVVDYEDAGCHDIFYTALLPSGSSWHRVLNKPSKKPVNEVFSLHGRLSNRKVVTMDLNPGGKVAAMAASQTLSILGDLPEWDLGDLYPGMDAPELSPGRLSRR